MLGTSLAMTMEGRESQTTSSSASRSVEANRMGKGSRVEQRITVRLSRPALLYKIQKKRGIVTGEGQDQLGKGENGVCLACALNVKKAYSHGTQCQRHVVGATKAQMVRAARGGLKGRHRNKATMANCSEPSSYGQRGVQTRPFWPLMQNPRLKGSRSCPRLQLAGEGFSHPTKCPQCPTSP